MSSDKVLHSIREDDFVEYFIFPDTKSNENNEEFTLNSTLSKINEIINRYASNYLWHKDEFALVCRPSSSNILTDTEHLPPHLYGISHFGENIEDEWFIVFLLRQITLEINDVIVRVIDSDGEFLLIEAANSLPPWANPEGCENRVYIYQGNVHILEPTSTNNLVSAVNLHTIRNMPKQSEAPKEIQNAIISRVFGYPEKIEENLHKATVYVPVGVAAILKHKPNLISPAIQSFTNRDPIDMRACRAMKYFPPENRVSVNVTFTKCLYAMLVHSKYVPDRRTGWNLPPVNSAEHKSHGLGVRIACGFEILAAQAKPSDDLENDKGWQAYITSLKAKNYFENLLEHSQGYNNLLNKAKEYYIKHRDTMHCAPVLGQEILTLLKTLDFNAECLRQDEQQLPPDDDESWLNVNPEELDKFLEERYGQKKIFTANGNGDANNFSGKLSQFLNHVSDLEGAEFPNQDAAINEACDSPVRPQRGIKTKSNAKNKVSFSHDTKATTEKSKTSERQNGKVSFDANTFSCAIQSMLDFVIPEDDSWDLESESDMSDYGDEADTNVADGINPEKMKSKLQEYMDAMDKELSTTTIGKSFAKKEAPAGEEETFDDIESFKPVDIDMNALKNILESYQSQMGDSGPASNMLGPMGIHLEAGSSKNGATDGN